MIAAHTLGNVWLGDPSTEAVPEATEARMKVLDETEVEDDERLLASCVAVVVYERAVGPAGSLPWCHGPKQDE